MPAGHHDGESWNFGARNLAKFQIFTSPCRILHCILLICLLAEVDEEDSCPPDLEAVELQQQQQQQRQQQQQFEKLQQQQQVIFLCEIETGV